MTVPPAEYGRSPAHEAMKDIADLQRIVTRPSDRAIAQAFWEIRPSVVCDAIPFRRSVIDRARELDATAAPVVVGEGMVERVRADYSIDRISVGEILDSTGCNHNNRLIRSILTAALAGED